MLSDFQILINALARSIGLSQGDDFFTSRTWQFDSQTVVLSYEEKTDALLIKELITECTRENRHEIYEKILMGNYCFAETGGATLTIKKELQVYLQARYPLNRLNVEQLEQLVTNFLDIADLWRNKLESTAANKDNQAHSTMEVFAHLNLRG